ncbi:hypothetical protein K8I85_02960 [bacterium]|nr:hypothetical protein [bacterium]
MPRRLPGAAILALCLCTPALAGTTVLLDCDFDSEPLDTEIGTGGAAVGQPYSSTAPAFVRNTPFATPGLEIGDDSAVSAQSTRFEFLNDWSISTGTITFSMNLWLHTPGQYTNLYIREHMWSSQSFLNLRFGGTGDLAYGYAGSGGNTTVGSFQFNVVQPLTIAFDLDAETVSATLDGTPFLTDAPFGYDPIGIGAIAIGMDFDADSLGTVSIDDLLVTSTNDPSPVDAASWGAIKADWRGE